MSELLLILHIFVDNVRTVVDIVHVCLLTVSELLLILHIFVDNVRTVVDIVMFVCQLWQNCC